MKRLQINSITLALIRSIFPPSFLELIEICFVADGLTVDMRLNDDMMKGLILIECNDEYKSR